MTKFSVSSVFAVFWLLFVAGCGDRGPTSFVQYLKHLGENNNPHAFLVVEDVEAERFVQFYGAPGRGIIFIEVPLAQFSSQESVSIEEGLSDFFSASQIPPEKFRTESFSLTGDFKGYSDFIVSEDIHYSKVSREFVIKFFEVFGGGEASELSIEYFDGDRSHTGMF